MLAKVGSSETSDNLAEEFIQSIERQFGSYVPVEQGGGTFQYGTTGATNALEVAVDASGAVLTTNLSFVLARTAQKAATNVLSFAGQSVDVVWAANETSKTVSMSVPTTARAGTTYTATLVDKNDAKQVVRSTATVVCTNRVNSISYPYWLGERTAETLNYGEWTMDLAIAKQKAANDTGYVLMNLGGDLWCPDCVSAADSLYADAAFAQWSRDNKVALVAVDVPRSTNLVEASLLTYVAGGKWNKSGAFYRSSKMISEDAAQSQLASNWMFATNTYKLASSSGWRVSVPVMVLMRPDGSVVGHFMAKEGGVADANGIYVYETAENIARLDELLALANQPGGNDNEAHKDSSTTTLTHTVGVSSDSMTLQINDNAWFYRLDGLAAGKVSVTATTKPGAPAVTLELFTSPSGRYGDGSKAALASGNGAVTASLNAATVSSNVYLRVGAYPNATGSDTRGKDTYSFANASSLFDVTVTSTPILVPEEVSQAVTFGTASVAMEIVAGNLYKLSGFDAASLAAYFTASNGLYVAKTTNAAAALDLASGTGEVSYQLWKPGSVQFAQASDRKMEMDGSGAITVTRTGGKSGAITVNVSVDNGANGTKRVSVSPATLTWAEGETTAKTVRYTIQQVSGFNADEVFTMTLSSDDASALGAQKAFALTVSDTDAPVLPSDSISVDAFVKGAVSESYAVYNIKGNGKLTLKKGGSLPNGVKISYDKKTRQVILSGTPKKAGTFTTTVTLKERRDGQYVTGPETTFTIVVRDPSSAASMAGYGVANAYYGKSVSATLPIIDVAGTKRMTGLLTVAISASNRVKATFAGADGQKTTFGNVQASYDSATGSLVAMLTKNGAECSVELSADGKIGALYLGAGDESAMESPAIPVAAASDTELAHYAGSYTVTFPRVSTNAASVAAGTAYATLTISAKGVAKYSGVMPNGTAFSGRVKIVVGKDAALVPVFKTARNGTMSALLNVLPDAKEEYESNNPAIILAEDGTVPFWSCSKGVATDEDLKAYGGYYAKGLDLEAICTALYAKNVFVLDFGLGDLDWTDSSAAVAEVPTADVEVSGSSLSVQSGEGVTIKLAARTGVVTGKVTLTLANGRTTKATFKGIVLLGWEDCNCGETAIVPENRPFVSGTCSFTDTVNGVKVTRSIPVDLNVKAEEQ